MSNEYMAIEVYISIGHVGSERSEEVMIDRDDLIACKTNDDLAELLQPHVEDLISEQLESGWRLPGDQDELTIETVRSYLEDTE